MHAESAMVVGDVGEAHEAEQEGVRLPLVLVSIGTALALLGPFAPPPANTCTLAGPLAHTSPCAFPLGAPVSPDITR